MDAMKIITEGMIKEDRPEFNVGDTVRVSVRIKEGERERIQAFEGTTSTFSTNGEFTGNTRSMPTP